MSQKKVQKSKSPAPARPAKRNRQRRNRVMAVGLILAISLAGLILAQWRSLRTAFIRPAPQAAPTPPPPSQPSKEYIYAGGKLVATEEPTTAQPNVPSPSGLSATAQFSGQTLTGVLLHWTSPSGTVNHFRIERTQNKDTPFVPLQNTAPSDATTFTDTSASPNMAYLYRICAVDGQGNLSAYSNIDLSTTVWFVDDPLVSYAEDHHNATYIKAAHFTQLREAVNAVRHLADANAVPFDWTTTNNTPPPQTGGGIYASHLTDLRTNLEAALRSLSLPLPTYQYPTIISKSSVVHKADLQELRDAVR